MLRKALTAQAFEFLRKFYAAAYRKSGRVAFFRELRGQIPQPTRQAFRTNLSERNCGHQRKTAHVRAPLGLPHPVAEPRNKVVAREPPGNRQQIGVFPDLDPLALTDFAIRLISRSIFVPGAGL